MHAIENLEARLQRTVLFYSAPLDNARPARAAPAPAPTRTLRRDVAPPPPRRPLVVDELRSLYWWRS